MAFGDDDPATEFFHLGPREAVRNCRREKLNAVLWKFLACHGRHAIRVLMTEELRQHGEAWREVGGETEDDVSMDDYLLGWRGR